MHFLFFLTFFLGYTFGGPEKMVSPIDRNIGISIVKFETLFTAKYFCKVNQNNIKLYFITNKPTISKDSPILRGCSFKFFIVDPKLANFKTESPTNSPEEEKLKLKQEHFFKKIDELKNGTNPWMIVMNEDDMYTDAGCDAISVANEIINPSLSTEITISKEDIQNAYSVINLLRNTCSKIQEDWKLVQGSLTQISVGYNGITCGVNIKNEIYCKLTPDSNWFQLTGSLKQISVGKYDTTLCGVNNFNFIFCRRGFNSEWTFIPGLLKWISVSSMGRYWGVNNSDEIYKSENSIGLFPLLWKKVEGSLKQVSVGFEGRVCGVNKIDQIYCKLTPNSEWVLLKGALKEVSVSVSDYTICGVNSADETYCKSDILSGIWVKEGISLKNVEVYGNQKLWGVNSDDKIFQK